MSICEYNGCRSTKTETEKVLGRPLTLCQDHGEEVGYLLNESRSSLKKWLRTNLKPDAQRKWKK